MHPILGTLPTSAFALVLVLGLVLLAARALRGFGLAPRGPAGARARRLVLLESLPLDRSRRLTLVRCDGREVLLLTGAASEVVVGWVGGAEVAREVGA